MEIYYFTGTGNSLFIAQKIAEKTGGKLASISSVIDSPEIKTESDTIAIVFPAYFTQLYGIPLIVERFLKKLEDIKTKYIIAVCSYGGYTFVNGLPTLKNTARLIKSLGGCLWAGFPVRMPMNNLDYDHIPVPINRNHDTILKKADKKLENICRRIIRKKKTSFRAAKAVINFLLTPMYYLLTKYIMVQLKKDAHEPEDSPADFRELIPLTDRSMTVTDKCTGCGTCVRVCPVHNIKLENKRPVWLHHCEMCFACDEWCPEGAIHHWSRADGVKYRHPDTKLSDMLKQCR